MGNPSVYEPDEDSFFLLDNLKTEISSLLPDNDRKNLSLLDMGAGSGYLGFEMAKLGLDVSLVDINSLAVTYMQLIIESNDLQIPLYESDLFEKVPLKKFDVIIFNTPYLPNDGEFDDSALHGGVHGYETACRFIDQVTNFLSETGFILLLTSSLAKPEHIEEKAKEKGFSCKIIAQKSLFFEELQIYKLKIVTTK